MKRKFEIQKVFALAALVILYIFFSLFGRNFFSMETAMNILSSSYFVGFLAIGVTFVIITGGIDLSIGAVMMCSAVIGGYLYTFSGVPLPLALFIMVLIGTAFGLINGLLVTVLKLPPFISTLGTMMVALGFGSIVSKTTTQHFPSMYSDDKWFGELFYRTQNGFPSAAVYLLVFFVLALILLNRTKIGRYVYAIGSNEEAVRLSGVRADHWKLAAFVICGFFAGLASIFYAATYSTVTPNTGNGQELNAIAAVVIGGTSLSGGVGSLTGTIIGVFVMSVLKNGLSSLNIDPSNQVFFTGLVVIGAVLLDQYRKRIGTKALKRSGHDSKPVPTNSSNAGTPV